jgi:hypothetical protein
VSIAPNGVDTRRDGFRVLAKAAALFVVGWCVSGGLLTLMKLTPGLTAKAFAFLFIAAAACGVAAVVGVAFLFQAAWMILFRNDRVGVLAGIVLTLAAFPLSVACYFWFR